tara:strand:+ start:381 stop:506 length:126 start_codon:yes stop_codon:yes gene_type:complete
MWQLELLKHYVITMYTAGPYDILIIQNPHGEVVTIKVEEYE